MDRLNIEIENCYGINKLSCEFDFARSNSTHVIYAPNGVMKTSFANVFDDYSKGVDSKDLIYPNKISVHKLTGVDNTDIDRNSIFVIRPYERDYKSEKISTLLVNDALRRRYEEIHKKIDIEKEKLLQELKKASGLKKTIEEEVSEAFTGRRDNFFVALERLEKEILNDNTPLYSDISYALIFEEKVLAFLETGDFKRQIKKYIEKYDELLNESTYLKKGFNHYNALTVHKNLSDNGFFKAEHTVNLNNKGNKTEVINEKDLLKLIQGEKEKILNDDELKTIFEAIDKKISNEQLRGFREYLFEHKDILPELSNLNKLRETLWITYIKNNRAIYQNLLLEYRSAQKEISNIVEKAKKEKTEWESVIDIFNRRFYVPYKLEVKNKEDAILRDEAPSINYFFKDREENVEEDLLLRVLSQGERRALYLLNIVFEIESRKQQGLKTLFIIDDIADSFDYKNKYAIIEYLKEISEDSNFFSIILTHNFDFFRTVQDRVGNTKWGNSYMALKEKEQIHLKQLQYKYISNPFKDWKENLLNQVKLIASVTFARNITEYIGDTENFNKLTCILHIKQDTKLLTIKDIENIYRHIFLDLAELSLENSDKKIYELLFEIAERLYNEEAEAGLILENKVVLAMAIRLKAEEFMIEKINDSDFVRAINSNQTGKLFGRYKRDFAEDTRSIEILERVNLMTPENIHLNSFMYEPILDMSDYHLKQLYKDVMNVEDTPMEQVAVELEQG